MCDAIRHLAGHELPAAARRLVVEEHAATTVHAVALAVDDRNPVAVELGHSVGAAGVKGGPFALRRLLRLAEHLAAARLVEANSLGVDQVDRLQDARHTHGVELTGEHRLLPADG